MKTFVALGLTLALAGCETSGRLGELPAVANAGSASTVTVVRASAALGAGVRHVVAFGKRDILSIGSGEYAEFLVPAGEQYISTKCYGGFNPGWKEESVKFIAKGSEQNYFLIKPNRRCSEISQVDGAEAAKYLQGAQRIDLEKPGHVRE